MSLRMLVYLFTVELDCLSEGFLIIGCIVASRTWRHRACVRLSGGDAARGEEYTERGDVVLDGADHHHSASVRVFVVPGRIESGLLIRMIA